MHQPSETGALSSEVAGGSSTLRRVLGTLCDVFSAAGELLSREKKAVVSGYKSGEIAWRVEDALNGDTGDLQRLCVYLEATAASLLGKSRWENPKYPPDHQHGGIQYSPSEAVREQVKIIREASDRRHHNITFSLGHMSHYILIVVRDGTVTNVEFIGQNGEGRQIAERWNRMQSPDPGKKLT